MSKLAVEHLFTGTTQDISSYDSTKTLLGTLIKQRTGAAATDKVVGPMPIAVARPMEQSTANAVAYPYVINWSSRYDWVFLADISTAALTRRIYFYEYDKTTFEFNWKGFITLNFSAITGNKTIRGFRVTRNTHTSGTVSVSGTAVTGSSTAFQTDRIAVGARIGFGSTDPTAISTWYEISAIGSDTSITLGSSAGTVGGGTSYVIEELRIVCAITNATVTNGGLFVAKGLNYSTFQTIGTNIAEGATTDNVRAIFWLADAATVTNTVSSGIGIDTSSSATSHFVWVLNGTTTAKIFKYDLRASLGSLSGGKSTSAFVLATGTSGTLTGTAAQTNNGRVFSVSHGAVSGVKSFWFTTGTRIYRVAESGITSASTTFLSDNMVEIPPGGAVTFAAGGAMQTVDYIDSIDRIIVTSSGAAGIRSYITKYNTISDPMDHIFLVDGKQLDQSTVDSETTPFPGINATGVSIWSESGIFYICRNGTTAALNQIYSVPLGADWAYASTTNQRVITPSLSLTNASKLYRVYVNEIVSVGGSNLGINTEPYRIYARTSGISDNSGSWTLISGGDLTGFSAASAIQFMLEFKMIGQSCVPARIMSIGCIYEDSSTDSHFQPSVANSNISSKRFAWRFSTAFGSTVPTLRVRLYNAVSGGLLVDDDSVSAAAGTWEKSTDGGSGWVSWNTTDKGNETTYLRFTPTSLGDNIKVRALLTQN